MAKQRAARASLPVQEDASPQYVETHLFPAIQRLALAGKDLTDWMETLLQQTNVGSERWRRSAR